MSANFLKEFSISRANEPTSDYYCEMPSKRGCRAELTAVALGIVGLIVVAVYPPMKHIIHREEQSWIIQCGVIACIALTIMFAEFIRRICIFVEECFHLKTRYEGRVSALLLQVLGCRPSALWSFLIVSILVFFTSMENGVGDEIKSHWSLYFAIAAIYLLMISVLKIAENPVEWDVLLDGRLMAVGNGLAYSYYYGFLKIILPPIPTDFGPGLSIQQRAQAFESHNKIKLFSKKLFILVPDTCFCHPNFESMWPGNIERVGRLEDVVVSRAGMKGRPYSATVYRVTRPGNHEPLYVIIEMPSILFTLYEMNLGGEQHAKLSANERRRQAKAFCRILKNLLEEDPSCKDFYEIIYYRDQVDHLTSPADLITRGHK